MFPALKFINGSDYLDGRSGIITKLIYLHGDMDEAGENFHVEKWTLVDKTPSPIQEFYKDKTVFITGATGFLGSLLVEKLLRCCPGIRKLILLIRPKRSNSIEERIKNLFSDPVFDRMRLSDSKYYQKVDIVCGEIDLDNFGLSPNDERLLVSQTNIVFHVAATVRFDEHIRDAYNMNVKATKTLLSLAKRMKNLESLIYVSTAYSNLDKKFIKEVFYPPSFTEEQLSTILDSCSDSEIAVLTEHIIAGKYNTYTTTKAAAEDLIRKASEDLPVCVFRPSIVMPTLEEPQPFWIRGGNGLLGVSAAVATGLLRCLRADIDKTVDIVPGDRTINAMVALAWYQRTLPYKENQQRVFNYVSCNDNDITFGEILMNTMKAKRDALESCRNFLWPINCYIANNEFMFFALFYILHFIPAVAFSIAERLTHQKPVVMMYYRKILFLHYFTNVFGKKQWNFANDNVHLMMAALSETDQKLFDFSMTNFRWQTMIEHTPRVLAMYLLKDPPTKENYQKNMIYRVWVDYCFRLLINMIFVYLFLSLIANLMNSLMFIQ